MLLVCFSSIGMFAQNCTGLPATPTSATTATQDRDQMMCQLGLTFPALPTRSGSAWPWNDPTAPTNAWPKTITTPEGNWTDAQGHTIVRTSWGNWHTYDAEPQFEPPADLHYPNVAATYKGGAMTGVGDYGPFSNPRYTDIELLEMKDGTPVNTPEDWWTKRRPEVFQFVQNELYGTTLKNFVPNITWTKVAGSSGNQTGTNGVSYPYRQYTFTGVVDISSYPALRNTPRIVMNCRIPGATGRKYPAIVAYGGNTTFTNTAPYNFGVCGYSNSSVAPDSGGASLSSYVIGLKNQGSWRSPTDPGALVSWAWGISRFIDYLQSSDDPDVDWDKMGVEGHSRYGKASLVTAAYDDRIVAAFPSCGGALGTSWARRAYGETLDFVSSSTSEYHWIAGNAMSYAGPIALYGPPENQFPRKVQYLDADVHSMMALIAPRVVLTNGGTDNSSGNGDAWQDPRGMYLAGAVSGPVWEFLGWPGQIIPAGTLFTTSTGYVYPVACANNTTAGRSVCDPSAESVGGTPPFDVAFIEGTVGWRRHKEGHTDSPDWPTFALFASRYFNDGRPVVAPQSFNLGSGSVNYVGTVVGSDPDAGDLLNQWQIKGGDGVGIFKIDPATGDLTIPDPSKVDTERTTPYTLTVFVGDAKPSAPTKMILPSHDATITVNPAPIVAGTVNLITTATLTKLGDGSYQAAVKVANRGTGTAQNVWLSNASLGAGAGSTVPQSLVNIPAGSYVITTITFPAISGNTGTMVAERFGGTYKGGSFVAGIRAVLP